MSLTRRPGRSAAATRLFPTPWRSGFNKPSKSNEAAFLLAGERIAAVTHELLDSLDTNTPRKNREEEAAKARARAATRFS
ncbi:MAG: DUF2277 family protein [Trueperaceae bacterium]